MEAPKNFKVSHIEDMTYRRDLNLFYDAYVIGKDPFAISSNGVIISDTIGTEKMQSRINKAVGLYLFKTSLGTKKSLIPSGDIPFFDNYLIILKSRWNHYGHWLPEHLFKLKPILDSNQFLKKELFFIVEKDFPGWKLEILEHLGFSKKNLIFWEGKPLHAKKLLVPSYPTPGYNEFIWLKKQIINLSDNNLKKKKIYLTRKNAKKRRILNENELIKYLKLKGFEILSPENYSPLEQASIFSKAKVIIGPHGSAFTNIIYSENSTVVEIHNITYRLAFKRLSLIMGHKYLPYFVLRPTYQKKKFDDDYIIDIKDFIRYLCMNLKI